MELWISIHPNVLTLITLIFSLRHLKFIAVLKPLDVTQYVDNAPAHDSFIRLRQRQPPDTEALWDEVKSHVKPKEDFLIVDDSTLEKPYAKEMAFIRRM